jgi:uncharacterized protein YqgC (DUF456 family)
MLDPTLIKILFTILCAAGLVISFFSLPGIILVFVAVFLYAWSTGFVEPPVYALVIAAIITVASLWIDNLAMLMGAKKLGGSNWGVTGAAIGGIIGLFFGPLGIILFPIIGAIIVELIVNPNLKTALKSGAGTSIGYFVGMFLKIILTIIMFIWAMTVIW